MNKVKLSLTIILSTTVIASSVFLLGANSSEGCVLIQSTNWQQYQQPSWLRSPLVAIITLPGIALASALYVGGKYVQDA